MFQVTTNQVPLTPLLTRLCSARVHCLPGAFLWLQFGAASPAIFMCSIYSDFFSVCRHEQKTTIPPKIGIENG